MPHTVALSVRSRTGNTRRIADALRERLDACSWQVEDVVWTEAVTGDPASPIDIPSCDTLIICSWCDRSMLDPSTRELIAASAGKRILVFCTMGGYPDGPYADKVTANIVELVEHDNVCLGVFLCQGKVSMANVERRRNLPADHPHHLDDAGVARLVESQKHPDASDIARAVAFLDAHLDALAGE